MERRARRIWLKAAAIGVAVGAAIGVVIHLQAAAMGPHAMEIVREWLAWPLLLVEAFAAQGGASIDSGGNPGLSTARLSLASVALISAGIYIGIIYAVTSALVKNFDTTVRKLAGTS